MFITSANDQYCSYWSLDEATNQGPALCGSYCLQFISLPKPRSYPWASAAYVSRWCAHVIASLRPEMCILVWLIIQFSRFEMLSGSFSESLRELYRVFLGAASPKRGHFTPQIHPNGGIWLLTSCCACKPSNNTVNVDRTSCLFVSFNWENLM